MELDDRKKLNELIGKVTRADLAHLQQDHIQEIKKLLKRSRDNVTLALDVMITHLKEKNSQVRYLALGLLNWLIERSPAARVSFAEHLPNLIPLFIAKSVSAASNKLGTQLPDPAEYAAKLSALGTALLQEWADKYADMYAFKRARSYLDTLQAKAPPQRAARASDAVVNPVQQHALEDALREVESQLLQIENAMQVLQDTPDDVEQFLAELQRASTDANSALATPSDEFADIAFEEVECAPVTDLTLDEVIRTHGLGSDTYELELAVPVHGVSSEQKSVDAPIEPLTELLSATVLPLLKEAQSALTRLLTTLRDVPEGNFKSRAVTHSLNLQQRLTRVKGKLVERGVVQEKREEPKSLPDDTQANNNASRTNSNAVAPAMQSRKRKSVGNESKRPKQRRKTR